ncbi:hypothetical protein INT45_002161 [Circinella minor]|uniref:HTH myb-type domain-containing protein n=1 Tax=Circinella minor TaxID=1195481 RepID=A0A8H7VAM8_9FUNG|nr:hypothetical protein INT45_002161 [Circinella minor]
MVTLVDKIKRADDAGCEVFNAIRSSSNWGFKEPEMSKKLLFNELEASVKDIDPEHRYIDMDSFMSSIQLEHAFTPNDQKEGKIQRQIARVNLFVFAVAIWTGKHLDEALREFFRKVIPKNISDYSDQLFDLYVAVASWAANIQVDDAYKDIPKDTPGPNVLDILKHHFPDTLDPLGLSNTDADMNRLFEKIKNKFDWIHGLGYLDPWDEDVEKSIPAIRKNWINIIYEIIGEFDTLYPAPDTQRTAVDESDEHPQNIEGVDDGDPTVGNAILEEEEEEEEFTTVPNDINPNNESDGLEDDDDEEINIEDTDTTNNSSKRTNVGDDNGAEEEDQELEKPPAKRPRVIPANSQDNQSVLDRDSDDPDSTYNDTGRDPINISSPQSINPSSDDYSSTSPSAVTGQPSNEHIPTEQSLNENEEKEQSLHEDEQDESVSSEHLPHGLPRTINEGPTEGFSDDSNSDDDYADALQTTEAERSQSIASVPTRSRRDLTSLTDRARQAAAQTTTITTETTRTRATTVGATITDNHNTDVTNTTTTQSNTIPMRTEITSRTTAATTTVPERLLRLKRRKPYTPWTADEVAALEEGLGSHGPQWALIKCVYKEALRNRTNVQLKDKARNELTYRKKAGEPLGVYAQLDTEATSFQGEASVQRVARRAAIRQRQEMAE